MTDPIDRPPEEDPWNEYDEEIAALLALLFSNRFSQHRDTMLEEYEQSLDGKGDFSFYLWQLSGNNPSLMNMADEDAVTDALTKALASGAALHGAAKLSYGAQFRVDEFIKANTAIIRRFADLYFSNHSLASILGATERVDPSLPNSEKVAIMAGVIDGELAAANPYWRLVSGQAAVRTHNYGILKTAAALGMTGYRLVAVIDSRTTRLCRGLHGREFWISDGIARYESIIGSDPSNIASTHPWIDADMDVANMSSTDLVNNGILVPPFHAYCRTTLQPI